MVKGNIGPRDLAWVSKFPEEVTFELRLIACFKVNDIFHARIMVRIRSQGKLDGIKELKFSLAIADLEDGKLCQHRAKANFSNSTVEQIDMSPQRQKCWTINDF